MTILRTIQDAFINLKYRGFTVASYLAQHQKTDALEKVIALGAKVEDAIYGAALAGDTELVKKYLGEKPTSSYVRSAIRGYSRAGHFNAIYELPDYKDYLDERVLGASQGGFSKQIEPWLIKDCSLLSSAVEGYVDANDPGSLLNILKNTKYYPQAIYFAARSGCTTLVDTLLEECGVKKDSKYRIHSDKALSALEREAQLSADSYFNQAANGYVAGGHYKEAAKMLEYGADVSLCISEIGTYSNLEPFWALYCSIDDEKIAESLLAQLQFRLNVDDKKIPADTLKTVQGVKELMSSERISYLAAKNKVEQGKMDHLPEGENITLPDLLRILSQEFDFDFQNDLEQSADLSMPSL